MILDIFKKGKKKTPAELVEAYQKIEAERESLKEKMGRLRVKALSGEAGKADIDAVAFELGQCHLGRKEIRRLLTEELTRSLEEEYKNLAEKRSAYSKDTVEAAREAGRSLAQAVKLLSQWGMAWASRLADCVLMEFADVAAETSYQGEDVEAFKVSYTNAIEQSDASRNFKSELQELNTIARRVPGGEAAENYVRIQVERLLDPSVQFIKKRKN